MRITFCAVAFAASSIVMSGVTLTQDREAITNLLSDAKAQAIVLDNDAQDLRNYSINSMSWQSHAYKLNLMRQHTNDVARILRSLDSMKDTGSPWQKTAIERIIPALNELSVNLQATIGYFNGHPGLLIFGAYRDFAFANADLASALSQTVADSVRYAQTKARFEEAGQKLTAPVPGAD